MTSTDSPAIMLQHTTTLAILVVLCALQGTVSGAYPKCQSRSEIQASWSKTTGDDFETASAITECREACSGQSYSTTLAGVRRNGINGGKVACYCGDVDVGLVSGCTYDCQKGKDNCGGSDAVSVYTACDPGLHNPDCSTPCLGECADDVCDIDSGQCNGQCQKEYYGSYCEKMCPNCASGTCNKDTGVCDGGCDPGWYTPGCNKECSPNCAQTSCDIVDGTCDGGCADGWYGPTCDTPCPDNCDPNKCKVDDGTCDGGCTDGFYDPKCESVCPTNCDGGCDKSSGDCTKCKEDEYYDNRCNTTCPTNCNQKVCDFVSGDCTQGCNGNYYDLKCDSPCSGTCNNTICNSHNGTCTYGCIPELYGSMCDIPCPDGCRDGVCEFQTGDCIRCEDGFYGSKTCDQPCPDNCKNGVCEITDGNCSNGCSTGWNGTRCTADINECADEAIASNCTATHGSSAVCHNTNGSYLCCPDGLKEGEDVCAGPVEGGGEGPPIGIIVGISLAIIVVIAAAIVGAIFFVRYRKRKRPTKKSTTSTSQSNHGFANTGFEDLALESAADDPSLHLEYRLSKNLEAEIVTKEAPVAAIYSNIPSSTGKLCDVRDFADYVKMRKSMADFFKNEYQDLPSETLFDWDEARREEVGKKNRFKGIYPYNFNRVKLNPIPGEVGSDYINASWIQTYNKEEKIIASSGPRERTLPDFWRMIWEHNVQTIVMVTNLVELSAEKCFQYWPEGRSAIYGDAHVIINKVTTFPDHVIRKLTVLKDKLKRTVTQYHFTEWPDHGAPRDATSLLNFRRRVKQTVRPNSPVVVHCSAGVGRTGSFIAVDYLINQAEADGKINVFECVEHLRKQRKGMIQTTDQYVFIHEALQEHIKVGDTSIRKDEFNNGCTEIMSMLPGGPLADQFQMLQVLAPQLQSYDKENALSPDNSEKNRFEDILPHTQSRVYLSSRVRGRNDYINAVRVNSYLNKDVFKVTQFPLESTMIDFWRMIQDVDSNVIVVLARASEAKEMACFVPAKNRPMTILENVAYVRTSMTHGPVRLIDITLGEKDETAEYMNIDDITKLPLKDPRTIRLLEVTVSDDQPLLEPVAFHEANKMLQAWRKETGQESVTVSCLNGAQYSGQFVACCNLMEMVQSEQEVDVYRVVKYIRDSRPEFINTMEQYCNLFDVVKFGLLPDETYANV